MTDSHFDRLRSWFIEAIALESEERRDFVSARLAEDRQLAEQLVHLLAHDRPVLNHGEFCSAPKPRVPGFAIKRRLGEGAMGAVYLAEREEREGELVAIKVLHPGLLAVEHARRFELEHAALVAMRHPNIALVVGECITVDGAPGLIMEWIDGLPITEHCRSRQLKLAERVRLFLRVCSGVQHAHRLSIGHRDLKPSNVLVTEVEGQAVPKIIDFGLALFLRNEDGARLTTEGRTLGTLEYMPPEQLAGDRAAMDLRVDVYALGVLLYELLCDQLPFDSRRLRDASPAERQRILEQEEPPLPSRVRAVPRVLDMIVSTAMAKAPERRYATVAALALDLKCFLANRPILARSPSATYYAWRFVRRNRWPSVAAVLLAVIAALIGLSPERKILAATKPSRAPDPARVWEVDDLKPWARGRRVEGYREAGDRVRITGEIGRLDAQEMILVVREVWHSSRHGRVFAPMRVYEFRRMAERTAEGWPRLRLVTMRVVLDAEDYTFNHRGEVVLEGERLVGEVAFDWRDSEGVMHQDPPQRIELRLLPH